MSIFRRYLALLSTCITLLGICGQAWAKFTPRVSQRAERDGTAVVLINDRGVIRLKTTNGNLTPRERAGLAAERLAVLIQRGLDPNALGCKVTGQSARLMAGEAMIAIATQAEARAHGTTPAQLVNSWVRAIRTALAIPPLSVSATDVRIPLGESRMIAVQSLVDSPVNVQVVDSAIVKAESAKPGTLILRGLNVGDTEVKVQCEEYGVTIKAHVRKYAGTLLGSVKGIVTGQKVPASLIRRAVETAARSQVKLEPGAVLRSVEAGQVPASLPPGSESRLGVCIEAAGGDYIPTRINTQALVENRVIGRAPTSKIMYSNDPERILRYQVLFAGRMTPQDEGVRLLYHHQNMVGQRIGFVIEIINASTNPANLHVIEGVAEPVLDPVIAGYKAGMRFLGNYRQCVGRIIDIAPGCRFVIVNQALEHGFTASGIMEFRQLSGEYLIVRVLAKPESQSVYEDPPDVLLAATGIDPDKIRYSDHVYPNPSQSVEVKYTAGKQWVFFRLGKDAIKHAEQDKWLYGNYGVIYEIKAVLENPSSSSQTFEFVFEPTAGPASAIFIVDDRLVPIKLARPPQEVTLERVTVPGESIRTVSICTMPLSGAAYPATLIIRGASTTALYKR